VDKRIAERHRSGRAAWLRAAVLRVGIGGGLAMAITAGVGRVVCSVGL
jgi:hypothetical protein